MTQSCLLLVEPAKNTIKIAGFLIVDLHLGGAFRGQLLAASLIGWLTGLRVGAPALRVVLCFRGLFFCQAARLDIAARGAGRERYGQGRQCYQN